MGSLSHYHLGSCRHAVGEVSLNTVLQPLPLLQPCPPPAEVAPYSAPPSPAITPQSGTAPSLSTLRAMRIVRFMLKHMRF
jgi:hypothetical protein